VVTLSLQSIAEVEEADVNQWILQSDNDDSYSGDPADGTCIVSNLIFHYE
jgi:hypothetical protein